MAEWRRLEIPPPPESQAAKLFRIAWWLFLFGVAVWSIQQLADAPKRDDVEQEDGR